MRSCLRVSRAPLAALLLTGCALLGLSAPRAHAQQFSFSFIDIDPSISVFGFNDSLQIYGIDSSGHVVRSGSNGQSFVSLGSLDPSFPNNTPFAINNSGVVVGFGDNPNGDTHAFVSSSNGGGTGLTDIGTLGDQIDPGGGYTSHATGINNKGQVTGYSDTVVNNGTAFPPRPQHAFIYQNGVLTDLGAIPDANGNVDQTLNTVANAINDAGDVVGFGDTQVSSGAFEQHAFVYHNGQYFTLGTLNNTVQSGANAINNLGQSVGYSTYQFGSFDLHAFVHTGTGPLTADDDIGTFGGANSNAFLINDLGQVIGQADDANGNSLTFLYQNHTLFRLSDLLPADAGLTLQAVYGINNSGQILGSGVDANGQTRYFILAVPEPGTWALLASGLFVGGAFARRRRKATLRTAA